MTCGGARRPSDPAVSSTGAYLRALETSHGKGIPSRAAYYTETEQLERLIAAVERQARGVEEYGTSPETNREALSLILGDRWVVYEPIVKMAGTASEACRDVLTALKAARERATAKHQAAEAAE
jgi:hypothetical protein